MPRKDGAKPLGDRIRVQHMLDAALECTTFITGRTREDLDHQPMMRRAVKDCIQEIGEAATKVSDEGRVRAPTLPWTQIVGMRHRVVHVYYDIDVDALWEVATRDLPMLIDALKAALRDWPTGPSTAT